jgi:hypothetical protein
LQHEGALGCAKIARKGGSMKKIGRASLVPYHCSVFPAGADTCQPPIPIDKPDLFP